jgi:hypothetical protein
MTVEKSSPAKKKEVEPEEYYFEYGSVTGMLEEINVHNGKNIFQLYLHNEKKIKCKFSPVLFEQIKQALGQYVEVYGRLKYKDDFSHNAQPLEIEVTDIEIIPEDDSFTLASLRGSAEGMLGDKTSEQYVRDIRNEWE